MVSILLSKGFFTVIDDADAELVAPFKWHATTCGGKVYAATHVNITGKPSRLYMHRLICDPIAGEVVDHISGDTLNNTRANLRTGTVADNSHNYHKKVAASSPYKGVCRFGSGWRARISANGKRLSLGIFKTEIEAAQAYDQAARVHYGEFASTNF